MFEAFEVSPADAYNRELLSNVHPSGWTNPEPSGNYNLVVVGGGTAGLVAAAGAAGLGAKVALVERHLMGGDCLNTGCVPSKSLLASARFKGAALKAVELGWKEPGVLEADFPRVMERLRRIRAGLSRHDSFARFQGLGVDVFLGQGRFTGPGTLEVEGRKLKFKKALIATGARAARPEVPGLAEAGYLTNETLFNLTGLPKRLAVLGGGPVGCEMAQAFRRLGSEVTLLHRGLRLLEKEDPDASAVLERVFAREGVKVVLDADVERVGGTSGGKVLHYKSGGVPGVAHVDEILAGAGRVPNLEGLGLEEAGVRFDERGGVEVDDRLRTTNPRIFAAGDVCLSAKFTHAADAAARIVVQNALFGGRARVSRLILPRCTYTDPEIAAVGFYGREAGEGEAAAFTQPLSGLDRALAEGEEEGFVRIRVKKGTDRITGAVIVAPHAGEMIGGVAAAMAGKIGLGRLASVVHPYPTRAEAVRKIADAYNRTRLTPLVQKILRAWLRFGRG